MRSRMSCSELYSGISLREITPHTLIISTLHELLPLHLLCLAIHHNITYTKLTSTGSRHPSFKVPESDARSVNNYTHDMTSTYTAPFQEQFKATVTHPTILSRRCTLRCCRRRGCHTACHSLAQRSSHSTDR